VSVTTALEPVWASGDARLIERLAANLLNNALEHNVPGGSVSVGTTTEHGQAVLRISNSGPRVDPGEVDGLIEPFRRADGRLSHHGHGLGLSIVAAITSAHDAQLSVRAPDRGGLEVKVTFSPILPLPAPDRRKSETCGDSAPTELDVAP
jgi:signal transduction histidine kinase